MIMSGINGITINDKQYIYVLAKEAGNSCFECCFNSEKENARCPYAGICVNFDKLIGFGVFKELKIEK